MTVYEGNRFEFILPNLTYIIDPSYKVRTQVTGPALGGGLTGRRVENPLWMTAKPNSFRNVKFTTYGDIGRSDPYLGATSTPISLPGGNYATKFRIHIWEKGEDLAFTQNINSPFYDYRNNLVSSPVGTNLQYLYEPSSTWRR
jgi:hypothetical protein